MIILAHKSEYVLPTYVKPTLHQLEIVKHHHIKRTKPEKVRIPKFIKSYFRGGPVRKREPINVHPGEFILQYRIRPNANQRKLMKKHS